MEGSFPYGDIIVIAAVAAFVILRYRAMLGEKQGRDVEPMAVKPLEEYERIIQLPERAKKKPENEKENAETNYGSFTDGFKAMQAIDREFTPEAFMEGARAAYEMVIEAYKKRDHETLKMLLAPSVYENFKASIAAEEEAGNVPDVTLIAIVKSAFAKVKLDETKATIAVDFHSEQVQLVRDKEGTIIDGDPAQQVAIEDRWVFTRDLNNSDPNWSIVET